MKIKSYKIALSIFCLILCLSANLGCQIHPKVTITTPELSAIKESYSAQSYPLSLYYLDGDCSVCLAKAQKFDEDNKQKSIGKLILFKVTNPVLTKMYVDGIALRSCVILDSLNLFAKSFTFNSIYTISENGEILSERKDSTW